MPHLRVPSTFRTTRLDGKRLREAMERLHTRNGIGSLVTVLGRLDLTPNRAAREVFGVSRQAVEQWLERGVPVERRADVDRMAEAVHLLLRVFKAERLPTIARSPMPALGGRSIIETFSVGDVDDVFRMIERFRSYVPTA